MQLGVRWTVGEPPHRSVPARLHDDIRRLEALHPNAGAWTLTWLEGRPRVQLDDETILELTATGEVRIRPVGPWLEDNGEDGDDDWLIDRSQ